MKTTLFLIAGSLAVLGCASKKYGDEKIQTKLETSDKKTSEKMGFDKDRNLMIQDKTSATDELMTQTHVNESLQAKLQFEYQQLKRCRTELSDVRLGGTGEMAPIPEIDGIKDDPNYKESVGIDESGDLVFVRQEKFEDRIKSEKNAEKSYRRLTKVISTNREQCELRMRKARVEAGLPAERTPAITRYEGGQVVIVQPAERNLDDAFRFANDAKQK
ncbi:MAG: hypothetical protein FJY29_10360 [Betaproteobacteria bacterium]|nr:hypothetical protein [Betaproteobacteria bacterium]